MLELKAVAAAVVDVSSSATINILLIFVKQNKYK